MTTTFGAAVIQRQTIQLYHPLTGQPVIVAADDAADFEAQGWTRAPKCQQQDAETERREDAEKQPEAAATGATLRLVRRKKSA